MGRVGLVSVGFIVVALPWAVAAVAGEAALREDFEGPTTSWRDVGGDAPHTVEAHGRVQGEAHSGDWCEQLRVQAQNGTYVFIRHEIGRAPVIDELVATVWLRSDRAGLQLLANVVLPRTIDPRTGRPLTTLIRGTTYSGGGGWQQLRVENTPQLLAGQVRVLRSQLHIPVDAGEAYVDAVLLNIYGGEGATHVGIDDLAVAGLVERAVDESQDVVQAAGQAPVEGRRVELTGSLLLVEGRPFFPRAVQYHGEGLEFLKQLGFNTVWLAEPPARELLRDAARLGLWLVSPPPFPADESNLAATQPPLPGDYDPVLAWDLGQGLTGRDVPRIQAWAEQVRRADQRQGRPLVCDAESQLRAHSRHCDVLRLSRSPLGTSLELSAYGVWLRERPHLARPGTPFWTTIQTSLAPALVDQCAALGSVGGSGRETQTVLESEPVRLLVYTALAAGTRGLVFESPSKLDDPQAPDATRLARVLERINLELDLIEPWAAAGKPLATVEGSFSSAPTATAHPAAAGKEDGSLKAERTGMARPGAAGKRGASLNAGPAATPRHGTTGKPPASLRGSGGEATATMLQTDRARLMVVLAAGPQAQYVPGQSAATDISFVVPAPETHKPYEITPGGLRPLTHARANGGMRVTLGEFGLTSLVLLTQDPTVVTGMSARVAQAARRAAQLDRELAAAKLADMEQPASDVASGVPQAAQWLAAARASFDRCDQALTRGDLSLAVLDAQRSMRPLRLLQRATWEQVVKPLPSPASSPLATSFWTLADQRRLADRVRAAHPGPNALPASDFEDLNRMLDAGWRHVQHPQGDVQSAAELSSASPHAGEFCLRVKAWSSATEAPPGFLETPPIWIESPALPVTRGQVWRIHGWVRIMTPLTGSVDGVMIVDSLAGEALAERVERTVGWREFTLYRVATRSGELVLTFALTGLGDFDLDDVSAEPLDLGGTP